MAEMMKVTVERQGGERKTYPILPITQVAFERQYSMGLGSLAGDTRLEYVYWLAWHAEKTSGAVVKPFDGWLADIVSVDPDGEPAPLDTHPPSPAL